MMTRKSDLRVTMTEERKARKERPSSLKASMSIMRMSDCLNDVFP